jgi:transcription antitermination factor NusG
MFDVQPRESAMQLDPAQFHVKAEPSVDDRPARWFVVATMACKEGYVLRKLKLLGLDPFLAQSVKTLPAKGARRKAVDVHMPLFRGYVFIRLPVPVTIEARVAILHTPCVLSILGTESGPSPLQEGFVEELAAHGPVRTIERGKRAPRKGDRLRVTHGAFTGLVGLVQAVGPRGRLRILMQMLASERLVELPVSVVEIEAV